LIGVGFDSRFVKPFVQEGYFAGELYVDQDMECYKALEYKRFTFFDLMKLLFSGKWKAAKSKADSMKISSDLKGDGFQNGGALIIDKGGKQLYEYIQEDAAEQISAEQILKTFKLSS
jgi:prostamide/prostaglandin F2alpha synthase